MRPGYEGHSSLFWEEIQSFHDHNGYWDENGLTEAGKKEVEFLLAKYDQGKPLKAAKPATPLIP